MGATLPCSAQAAHCGGSSCCGAQAPDTWASVVASAGLSSCGSWALSTQALVVVVHGLWLICGMCDLPGPGIEPLSPALAGRFLFTEQASPSLGYLNYEHLSLLSGCPKEGDGSDLGRSRCPSKS